MLVQAWQLFLFLRNCDKKYIYIQTVFSLIFSNMIESADAEATVIEDQMYNLAHLKHLYVIFKGTRTLKCCIISFTQLHTTE